MEISFTFVLLFSLTRIISSNCDEHEIRQDSAKSDVCENPETPSQGHLLKVINECAISSEECSSLSDCMSEKLVKISEETAADCRNSASESDSNAGRPCSVAATAYVLLEQIRRLLVESTVYKDCPQVKGLLSKILNECGEGAQTDATAANENLDVNDFVVQEILAKFLISIGKQMQTFDVVKDDIAELERSKHMKALGAMIISFALPGLLGLCEAAHFRTGLILQILALFVIGLYQFTRYGGYWASVGVGSCLLVMIVELGLLILIRKKFFGEGEEEAKKSE